MLTRVYDKAAHFANLAELIKHIEGNIVELGVGGAESLGHFCRITKKHGNIRTVWGFDSFEGFPLASEKDGKAVRHRVRRAPFHHTWCSSPEDAVTRIVTYCDYPRDKLRLVKGYFSKELFQKEYDGSPIALLHLDCDLYESYAVALAFFYYYVVEGGVIAFDEYRDPHLLREWPGAVRAIDEWLQTTDYMVWDMHEVTWPLGNRLAHRFYLVKRSKV